MKLNGKVWKFGNDINTDVIQPIPVITMPLDQQVQHVFKAIRPGWVDRVQPGEIIVGGHNFGTGSSRPAARNIRMAGIQCLLAESINGLFFRNSVNYGLWAMECPGVHASFEEGDVAEVDFETFQVRNARSGETLAGLRYPEQLLRILESGGIIPMLDAEGLLLPQEQGGA